MNIGQRSHTNVSKAKGERLFEKLLRWMCGNTSAILVVFAVYFIVQTVVRINLSTALRVDESQQILFGQWLAIGYDEQPPLYNWYQQAIFTLFGSSITTLALAKNLVLFAIFAVYAQTARLLFKDTRLVVVATLSLFLIPQVFWQAQRDLTHTTMLMLTFATLLYCTVRLILKPTTVAYLLTGLVVGLGMLSKYNFAVILPAVLFAVWMHPTGRQRIMDPRFLLTAVIAAIVVSPHAVWLLNNFSDASEATVRRMAEDAPEYRLLQIGRGIGRTIFGSLVIIAIPLLIVSLAAKRNPLTTMQARTEKPWLRFFAHYFIGIFVVLIAIILATTMTEVRDRWLLPLLMPFPLLLCLWLEGSRVDLARLLRRFLPVPMALMLCLPIAIVASAPILSFIGKRTTSNYPWQPFHAYLADEMKLSPSLIVTTDWPIAGNMRLQFGDVPVTTTEYTEFNPTFDWSSNHPVLLVWLDSDRGYEKLVRWMRETHGMDIAGIAVQTITLPMYNSHGDDQALTIRYAVVPPVKAQSIGSGTLESEVEMRARISR